MSKHYIEKPKKPACLQIQNIALTILCIIVFSILGYLFLFIFLSGMVAFFAFDIYQFKHSPEAILYSHDSKLYYYKKRLFIIPFLDIENVGLQRDKKGEKYIEINYVEDEIKKQILIKDQNAVQIIEDINKEIYKRTKTKKEKKEDKKQKTISED